jgi:hypothetical protein
MQLATETVRFVALGGASRWKKKSIFPSGYAGQECVGAQVGPEVKIFGFSFKKAKTGKKFNIAASAHTASNIHHRPFLFICSIEVDRLD